MHQYGLTSAIHTNDLNKLLNILTLYVLDSQHKHGNLVEPHMPLVDSVIQEMAQENLD